MKIRLVLISLFLLVNTIVYAQKTINFSISDFPEKIELHGEKLELMEPLRNPVDIILHDSLLFVKNSNTSPAVDVINLNSGKVISRFCKRGRGPGELVAPFTIQLIREKEEIMIQDIQGKKLVFFDLDLILKDAPKKYTRIIAIDSVLVRKIVQVKNENYFSSLIGHKNGSMNCLLNEKGELIKFLNQFPFTEIKYPVNPQIASNIFSTNIRVSSNMGNVIMPYDYWDKIDLFDNNGNFILELKGPSFKKMDVIHKNGRTSKTNKNNRSYSNSCSNDNYFMIPYSGKRRKYAFLICENIFSINFQGNLLKHYVVSPGVSKIAVDWEKRIIYGVNKFMEPTIYKYKF